MHCPGEVEVAMSRDSASGLLSNRVISTLMSGHSSTVNEGQAFVLKSGQEFAERSNQVFEGLKSLEEQHETRQAELPPSTEEVKPDPTPDDEAEAEATFKKPRGCAPRRRNRSSRYVPDYMKNPEKYQRYSLADVPEHTDGMNTLAAMQFLQHKKKEKRSKEKKMPETIPGITFHIPENPPKYRSPAECSGDISPPEDERHCTEAARSQQDLDFHKQLHHKKKTMFHWRCQNSTNFISTVMTTPPSATYIPSHSLESAIKTGENGQKKKISFAKTKTIFHLPKEDSPFSEISSISSPEFYSSHNVSIVPECSGDEDEEIPKKKPKRIDRVLLSHLSEDESD